MSDHAWNGEIRKFRTVISIGAGHDVVCFGHFLNIFLICMFLNKPDLHIRRTRTLVGPGHYYQPETLLTSMHKMLTSSQFPLVYAECGMPPWSPQGRLWRLAER